MADGYARVTGSPGVCFLISGPGVSNAATGLAEAYADSTPLVAVATTYLKRPGPDGQQLHDMQDQNMMLRGIAKALFEVSHESDAPAALARAFQVATTGRPGPVVVE